MRNNQPVTNVERFLKPGQPIVSKTDLKGNIVYVNPAFCEISGFSEAELIGQPHNIVRHPDMPASAYEDLWRTIQAGKPWRGLVKNRAINGDHYWVEAYVTPVRVDGRIVGYQSVRTVPDRAEVSAAENLYRAVREGRQTLSATKLNTLLNKINFAQRAWLAFVGLAILFLATGLAAAADSKWMWVFATTGMLSSLIGGGWWVSRALQGIRKVEYSLQQIEEGNFKFTLQVDETDEFADLIVSIRSLAVHLRALIADITSAATRVSMEADTLHESVEHLSEQTGQQSERAMKVSALTQEMSVTIGEINDATESTSASANETCDIVLRDEKNMIGSLESTQRIVDVVGEARSTLNDLNAAVERIGSMTSVIKEIADQTNLLALNAAIEAARAGETGRGFAVVADEVRKLAERTASSTQDITSNVTNIQLVTQMTLMTMDSAAEEVERGTASIKASNESLHKVLEAARTTVDKTGQIAESLRQQVRASHDVAQSIEEIASLVDSNSQEAQAVSSAAQQLTRTAHWMRQLVSNFERSI
ncbi:PAS domain S-box protein [Burkholderiaceae bacterium DAT-1]|nr:PAS domain S-box protein [Burkholderiaceae bacterium DAT-1]